MFLFRDEPFIPYIDALPTMKRNSDGPFMMPIVDKYSEMGTVVIGKVESGHCEKGQNLSIYPNRTDVKVDQLWSDDIEVTKVTCGENVKLKLKGVDKAGITPGFVHSSVIHKTLSSLTGPSMLRCVLITGSLQILITSFLVFPSFWLHDFLYFKFLFCLSCLAQ